MKIAYIGIDLFYPALLKLSDLGCEVAEIFTCKTDNVTEFNTKIVDFAEKNNIPVKMTRITADDIIRLREKGCKMAVCGGYYYRIPVDEAFPIVNIHPSLLPCGRGSWPMPVSILRRDNESGVTIHKIAEGFDTGDILIQEKFTLDENETHESFMAKASTLAADMMTELVERFDYLWQNARRQGAGEYLEAPTDTDFTVSCDMTVEEADLILRAFYGYECIYQRESEKSVIIRGRAVKNAEDKRFPLKDGFVVVTV